MLTKYLKYYLLIIGFVGVVCNVILVNYRFCGAVCWMYYHYVSIIGCVGVKC